MILDVSNFEDIIRFEKWFGFNVLLWLVKGKIRIVYFCYNCFDKLLWNLMVLGN